MTSQTLIEAIHVNSKIYRISKSFLVGSFVYFIVLALFSLGDTVAQEVGSPADQSATQDLKESEETYYVGSGPNVGVLAYCTDLYGEFGASNTANTLAADGRFGTVTLVDGDVVQPTAQDLLDQFDCVIAMTDNRCGSSPRPPVLDEAANVLTDYVNGGGGLVLSTFGYGKLIGFGTSIFEPGLSPFQQVEISNGPAGEIDLAGAAIAPPACVNMVSGVTPPVCSSFANFVSLSDGASLCTSYVNGNGLLAINAAGNVVGLNTFPGDLNDNTQASYRKLVSNAVFEVCPQIPIIPIKVEKDYRFASVCFEKDNDLDGDFNEDPVNFDPATGAPIDDDEDDLFNEDDIDCLGGTDLGIQLPIDTGSGKFLLEAILKQDDTVSSYNPGQYYAVSTVEVLQDLDTLWIIERYGDCTEEPKMLSALNPKMGRGGGNSVLVQVIDGVAFQIADSKADNVMITDEDENGVPDNAEAHLEGLKEGDTFLFFVKFGPGLKGMPIPDEPDNMCHNESATMTEEHGEEVSATADLIVLPKKN